MQAEKTDNDGRALLASLPVACCRLADGGTIAETNAAFERLLGQPAERLQGRPLAELVEPSDRRRVFELLSVAPGPEAPATRVRLDAQLPGSAHRWLELAVSGRPGEPSRIVTARDVSAEVQRSSTLEERTRELDVLLDAASMLGPSLDLATVVERVFACLRRVIDFSAASIAITEHGSLVVLAQSDDGAWPGPPGYRMPRPTEEQPSALWSTISQGRPVIIGDIEDAGVFAPDLRRGEERTRRLRAGVRSCLFVPLSAREQVIGMLSLTSRNPHAFTQREANLATALGTQVAAAIANARLYARSKAITTLTRGAASLTVDQPLEETLDGLAAGVVQATRAVACAILLADSESGEAKLGGGFLLPDHFSAVLRRHWQRDGGWVDDLAVRRDTGLLQEVRAGAGAELRHVWEQELTVPISYRGKVLGAISAYYRPTVEPSSDEEELLAAVANQAAAAVENARLYRRSQAVAALTRVASSLTVNQPLRATLDALAASVVQATAAIACSVVQIDEHSGLARVSGWHGLPEGYVEAMEASWANGAKSPTVEGFRERRIVAVRDQPKWALADPLFAPCHPFLRRAQWDKAFVVPIEFHSRPLGAINVYYRPGSELTADEEQLLTVIADQAAVAIENARLYDEAQSQAALGERQRLARELHDSVTQALFSTTLHVRAAQLAFEQTALDPIGPLGRSLGQLRTLTQGALAEMRALIFELRPDALTEEGLVAALRKQAAALAAREGLSIEVDGPRERFGLLPTVEEHLYRIALEALNNTVKHAGAEHIEVRVISDGTDLRLEVCDDGQGFDRSRAYPGHLGLSTMAERARSIGADFSLRSAPGQGTTVTVELPLASARMPAAAMRES